MPKLKQRRMNQAQLEAWRTRREQSQREELEREREKLEHRRELVERKRQERAPRSRGERPGCASEDESGTEEEPVKRLEDLTVEDLGGYHSGKRHGKSGFVVGTPMTWRQYMEAVRVFGDRSFQLIVPKKYLGALPTMDAVHRDSTLQHLVGVAFELWKVRNPPAKPRAPSPPSEVALSWGDPENASSTWTPYKYYWPSRDDPIWVVYSNRVIMPPPPPSDLEKTMRADARYGIHERQWLPQHCSTERVKPYLAFIPMLPPWKPDERHLVERKDTWYFKTAESPHQDVAWMTFDKERHTVPVAEGLWRFRDTVQAAVREEAKRAQHAWDEARQLARSYEGLWRQWEKYYGVVNRERTEAAMAYVLSESGTEWFLRCALADFQRGVLEVRGYVEFIKALHMKRDASMYDRRLLRDPTMGQVSWTAQVFNRRDSRGIFVDERVAAAMWAQYGIPVWLLEKYDATRHGSRLSCEDGLPVLSYGLVPELDPIVLDDAPRKGHDSAAQAATRKQQEEEKEKQEEAMAAFQQEEHAGFQAEQGQGVEDGSPPVFDVDEPDSAFQDEAWQPPSEAGAEVVTDRRPDTPPKNTGASSPTRSTSASASPHVGQEDASDDGWVKADDARLEPEEDDSDYEAQLHEQAMRKLAQSQKQRRPARWMLEPHPSKDSAQQQESASETVQAGNVLPASAQDGASQTTTAENLPPATVSQDQMPDSNGATSSTFPISPPSISQSEDVPRVQQPTYAAVFDDGADLPDYEEDDAGARGAQQILEQPHAASLADMEVEKGEANVGEQTQHPQIAIALADQPAVSDSGVMRFGSLPQKRKDPPTELDDPSPVRKKRNQQRHALLQKTLDSMPEGAQLKGIVIRMTTHWLPQYDLPDWWPSTLQVGTEAAEFVDTSRQREAQLAGCPNPVPQLVKGAKTIHKMPTLGYFANAWSNRCDQQKTSKRNVFLGLFRWLQIRPYYLAKIASDPIDEDEGFETRQWREILKGVMRNRESRPIVKRLGLDVAHTTMTEGQEAVDVAEAERLLSLRPLLEKLQDKCTFDGHKLPPPPWESEASLPLNWVSYIVWELAELEFRYDMLDLAISMRRWYRNIPELQATSNLEYYGLVKDCWAGGIEMVKPTREAWLCSSNARERLLALRSFAELMRYWPRASEMLGPWKEHWGPDNDAPTLESDEFRELERSAWVCYQQSYYDHRGRMAPLPCRRPQPPFAVENS